MLLCELLSTKLARSGVGWRLEKQDDDDDEDEDEDDDDDDDDGDVVVVVENDNDVGDSWLIYCK